MVKIVAYSYIDPLLETDYDPFRWGGDVDQVYQDFGERKKWQELVQECQLDPPDYLLIYSLAELGANLTEIANNLRLLESLQIEVVAIEQDYISSQFKTQQSEDLVIKLAEFYQAIVSQQKQNQLKKGHALNRIKALPPPGKPPYGYRRGQDKYILDRSSAPIVKAFFDHFLLFGSLRGAVKFIEHKYNKKIAVSTGKSWLTNPVYRGDLCYQTNHIIPNTHIAIVSREEAAQIDRLLRQNSKFSTRTASSSRSLAGLVICRTCQNKMTITQVKPKNTPINYLYLRSPHCPLNPKCKGIDYTSFLEKVIEIICKDLPEKVSQLQLPDLSIIQENLMKAIADQKQLIKTVQNLEKQGILDSQTAQLRVYKLQSEMAESQAQLAQLPPDNLTRITQAVSLTNFWLDLSEEERRFYFREFIQKIEIVRNKPQLFEIELTFIF